MSKTAKRFVLVTDTHGDEIDPKAESKFFEFVRTFKPHIRVHMGDAFDFKCLRGKALEEEKRGPLSGDVEAGIEFLSDFRPTHWLRGNHDERLWDAAKSKDKRITERCLPLLKDIKRSVRNAIVYPYKVSAGTMRLGDYTVIHGYNHGANACRASALVWGNVIMGHIHAFDRATIPGRKRKVGRSIGCLAKLNMEYARAQTGSLRQSQGWAYGIVHNGKAYIYDAEIIQGRTVVASGLQVA